MSGGGPNYEPHEGAEVDLTALVLEPRQQRIEEVVAGRTRSFTVVLDRLEDAFNMAAVLRTCEGMGVQDVHVVRNPETSFSPNRRVTQGCDRWLDIHRYDDFASCARTLKAAGFRVLVSHAGPAAQSLFDLEFSARTALVFGNERFGVSDEVLSACDGTFWIPMRGFTQSFNVSAAVSASVTAAMGWRARHGIPGGDLSEVERATLRETFLKRSVKQHRKLFPEP